MTWQGRWWRGAQLGPQALGCQASGRWHCAATQALAQPSACEAWPSLERARKPLSSSHSCSVPDRTPSPVAGPGPLPSQWLAWMCKCLQSSAVSLSCRGAARRMRPVAPASDRYLCIMLPLCGVAQGYVNEGGAVHKPGAVGVIRITSFPLIISISSEESL